jgi:hypothetical protein
MDINIHNLPKFIAECRNLLNIDFILNNYSINVEAEKSNSKISFTPLQKHPLLQEWLPLMEEAEQSIEKGIIVLSERRRRFLDKIFWLSTISHKPGFQDLIAKLRSRSHVQSTLFEAMVCAMHQKRGDNLEILSEQINEKTPDFQGKTIGGNHYFVECKSLEDNELESERIKRIIANRLIKMAARSRLTGRIAVTFAKTPTSRDIDFIISAAKENIVNRKSLISIEVDINEIKIKYSPGPIMIPIRINGLIDSTAKTVIDFNHEEASFIIASRESLRTFAIVAADVLFAVECEAVIKDNAGFIRAISEGTAIEILQQEAYDVDRKLRRAVRSAAAQLPTNAAGLIYIELPFKYTRASQDIYDRNFEAVQRQLGADKQHVAAVLLYTRYLDREEDGTTESSFNHIYIIPNPAHQGNMSGLRITFADNTLPENVDTTSGYIRTKEGTILFAYNNRRPDLPQLGRVILLSSSPDGQEQLKIWRSFDDMLRVDIIHPSFGRKIFACKAPDIFSSATFKMGVTWSREGISVATGDGIMKNEFSAGAPRHINQYSDLADPDSP